MVKERMNLMQVLDALEKRELVLPLFQRPFVWSEEQVCDLFDSLLQGYPIGHILLLEQVPPDLHKRLQCCFFSAYAGSGQQTENLRQRRNEVQIFDELGYSSHLVLDGQQRLFAFFIGIAGAYMRESYEGCRLYFDLYPLARLYFESAGDLEAVRAEHHQFRFYSDEQLTAYHIDILDESRAAGESALSGCQIESLQLPLATLRSWSRDRRTAKAEIRRYLRQLAALPKPLLDEFEDLLDNLHHHFWVAELVHNITVAPRNSYDLLEIFSRLNQGSSFRASDLHYAVRIVFPERRERHHFSRFLAREADLNDAGQALAAGAASTAAPAPQALGAKGAGAANDSVPGAHNTANNMAPGTAGTAMEGPAFGIANYEELAQLSEQDKSSKIFHELNPESSESSKSKGGQDGKGAGESANQSPGGSALNALNTLGEGAKGIFASEELEESYAQLLQAAEELRISPDFLYHCYLFCEAGAPEEIGRNIRKREGALALRNNGERLRHFAEVLGMLRDALDACNLIVRQWFADNLHKNYALLPVLHYFYKQATECCDPLQDLEEIDLSRIVRWIALNEIAPAAGPGVFRGSMQQLGKLWPVLHQSCVGAQDAHFPLQRLQQDIVAAFGAKNGRPVRSLELGDERIAELLNKTKIKSRVCIPLMALLYSHPHRIAMMERFEERELDCIQPQKLLSRRMLKNYPLSDEQAERIFLRRDSVLNLQWLPKRLKTEKGDIPFRQWLGNSRQLDLLGEQNGFNEKEMVHNLMRFHFIKYEERIYAITAFEDFLKERRARLSGALKKYGQDFSEWDIELGVHKDIRSKKILLKIIVFFWLAAGFGLLCQRHAARACRALL